MKFRHELKYEINKSDLISVRQRLRAVAKIDSHAVDGKYVIKSLYFDNDKNKALNEKIDGVNYREKFRIRLYNNDFSFITLEKKSKINGLCNKLSTRLTYEQTKQIINGDYEFLKSSDDELMQEFYSKLNSQLLKPKTVVEYAREPYIYPAGNVRVTFDYNIRTGIKSTDLLNHGMITVPAGRDVIIMEVKWDEYLPDVIKTAVSVADRRTNAFSKYAVCRIYG